MLRSAMITALTSTVLLSASCAETPVGDEQTVREVPALDGLRLELTLDKVAIPIGDSAIVTIRLRNENPTAVTINFSSGCQILPYIETAAGTVQYPGGGAWACTQALTSLDVPANGSVTRTLLVRGAASPDERNGAALVRGQYRVYALLDGIRSQQQLRSPTISFEIR